MLDSLSLQTSKYKMDPENLRLKESKFDRTMEK